MRRGTYSGSATSDPDGLSEPGEKSKRFEAVCKGKEGGEEGLEVSSGNIGESGAWSSYLETRSRLVGASGCHRNRLERETARCRCSRSLEHEHSTQGQTQVRQVLNIQSLTSVSRCGDESPCSKPPRPLILVEFIQPCTNYYQS